MDCCNQPNTNLLPAILPLIGVLIGGIITFFVTKWQVTKNANRAEKIDAIQRWNRICRNLRDLAVNLEVLGTYNHYLTLNVTDLWQDRSTKYFQLSRINEDSIIDDLSGSAHIKNEEKRRILEAITPRIRSSNSVEEIKERVKKVKEVIPYALQRVDPEIAAMDISLTT